MSQTAAPAIPFNPRIEAMQPSATLAMTARAKQLRRDGRPVIGLSAGEPDFDTPAPIAEAGIQAIRDGFTHYTENAGMPELREAICEKLRRDNGLAYAPTQVVCSNGAKQSVALAVNVLARPGDEVLIPAPYWVSYPEMTRMAGAEPVAVRTSVESDYRLTPEQLEEAITPRTRLLILCSPSNPTGLRLHAGRARGPRRCPPPARGRPRPLRRDLRVHPLRRRARLVRVVAGDGGADDHGERVLEGVCDDRLAAGLPRRAGAHRQGGLEGAKPVHLGPLDDHAEGGRGGAGDDGARPRAPSARWCAPSASGATSSSDVWPGWRASAAPGRRGPSTSSRTSRPTPARRRRVGGRSRARRTSASTSWRSTTSRSCRARPLASRAGSASPTPPRWTTWTRRWAGIERGLQALG